MKSIKLAFERLLSALMFGPLFAVVIALCLVFCIRGAWISLIVSVSIYITLIFLTVASLWCIHRFEE